jgi:hypothetical protein
VEEASMNFAAAQDRLDVGTLAAVIARSPIVVTQAAPTRLFPAGFDDVDIAVLKWIVAEARCTGRRLARI